MICRITDMHDKEVINLADGSRLGCVDDVEIDVNTAKLTALVLYGRSKMFGLMGHEEDIVIRWSDIEIIGEDTILVNFQNHVEPHVARKNSREYVNYSKEPGER